MSKESCNSFGMRQLAALASLVLLSGVSNAFTVNNHRSPARLFVSVSSGETSTSAFAGLGVSWDWEKVTLDVFKEDKRPVILFDGQCNLCHGGVNFALDNDNTGTFRFVSLQSKTGQSLLVRSGRKPGDISSIVLCMPDGQAYFESEAILRIAQGLNGPLLPAFGHLGILAPEFIRDKVYQVVANNRYKFGEADQCRMDWDGEFENRFVPDPEDLQ